MKPPVIRSVTTLLEVFDIPRRWRSIAHSVVKSSSIGVRASTNQNRTGIGCF
jgi:hypothetical protein